MMTKDLSETDDLQRRDWYATDGFNKRLPLAFMHNAPEAIRVHLQIQVDALRAFGFPDSELAIIHTPGRMPQIVPAKR